MVTLIHIHSGPQKTVSIVYGMRGEIMTEHNIIYLNLIGVKSAAIDIRTVGVFNQCNAKCACGTVFRYEEEHID